MQCFAINYIYDLAFYSIVQFYQGKREFEQVYSLFELPLVGDIDHVKCAIEGMVPVLS